MEYGDASVWFDLYMFLCDPVLQSKLLEIIGVRSRNVTRCHVIPKSNQSNVLGVSIFSEL